MNVYSYDEETFEYIGICKAYKNPKGKNYLIPAYSTQLAPPERGDNEIQVFILTLIDGKLNLITEMKSGM